MTTFIISEMSTEKTISAAKFKEQCLALIDQVTEEGLVITKHGKPVAKLIPVRNNCADLIGKFEGKVSVKGNILNTGVGWNAES